MQDTIRLHLSTNSELLHTNKNTVPPWTTTLTVKKKKKDIHTLNNTKNMVGITAEVAYLLKHRRVESSYKYVGCILKITNFS